MAESVVVVEERVQNIAYFVDANATYHADVGRMGGGGEGGEQAITLRDRDGDEEGSL